MSLFFFFLIGGAAGLAAALFGIGGGVITVPSLLLVFSLMKFPESQLMHMAIGTSLCAMTINTLFSSYFHHKKEGVNWLVLKRIVPGILLGAFLGSLVSENLSTDLLKILFGLLACYVALHMYRSKKINKDEMERIPGFFKLGAIGTAISFVSNLLGIGGGLFTMPIFLHYRLSEKMAIGTSSASTFLISLLGALGYILSGDELLEVPKTIGYVYLPAFFLICPGSILASFYGVKLTHHLPAATLRKLFAALLLIIGTSMIIQ